MDRQSCELLQKPQVGFLAPWLSTARGTVGCDGAAGTVLAAAMPRSPSKLSSLRRTGRLRGQLLATVISQWSSKVPQRSPNGYRKGIHSVFRVHPRMNNSLADARRKSEDPVHLAGSALSPKLWTTTLTATLWTLFRVTVTEIGSSGLGLVDWDFDFDFSFNNVGNETTEPYKPQGLPKLIRITTTALRKRKGNEKEPV